MMVMMTEFLVVSSWETRSHFTECEASNEMEGCHWLKLPLYSTVVGEGIHKLIDSTQP